MNMTGLLLVWISGICWTVVYIELIRNGTKVFHSLYYISFGGVCRITICILPVL